MKLNCIFINLFDLVLKVCKGVRYDNDLITALTLNCMETAIHITVDTLYYKLLVSN